MRRLLKSTALLLALATIATWAACGANRGWTKTSRAAKTVDSVTGLDGITYEKHFSPGVDFLAAGLVAAGALPEL